MNCVHPFIFAGSIQNDQKKGQPKVVNVVESAVAAANALKDAKLKAANALKNAKRHMYRDRRYLFFSKTDDRWYMGPRLGSVSAATLWTTHNKQSTHGSEIFKVGSKWVGHPSMECRIVEVVAEIINCHGTPAVLKKRKMRRNAIECMYDSSNDRLAALVVDAAVAGAADGAAAAADAADSCAASCAAKVREETKAALVEDVVDLNEESKDKVIVAAAAAAAAAAGGNHTTIIYLKDSRVGRVKKVHGFLHGFPLEVTH
jgi:hypothetical protein